MTKRTVLLAVLLFFASSSSLLAKEQIHKDVLIVGIKEAPPFVIKTGDGEWSGITVDLWNHIAAALKLKFQYDERNLERLLSGIKDGSLDVALGALTVTSQREVELDFTHPFYTTGLSIAVPAKPQSPWLTVIKGFISYEFLRVVVLLTLLFLVMGFLIWWFEHKKNPEQFNKKAVKGIGSGFWWSAVTMTTVGYGDKAPVTLGGRIVAIGWMFAGIILISSFTAAITASLTLTHFESVVQEPSDLPKVTGATVKNSTSEAYLHDNRIAYQSYATLTECLHDLALGKVEAVVYDEPLLRYFLNRDFKGKLRVLDKTFSRQDYSIALPQGSALRERINRELLQEISNPAWKFTLYTYLGR